MAERVDLEHTQRDAASLKRYAEATGWDDVAEFAAKALVMVAELRVAREVVEGVRNHRRVYLTPSQLHAHEATCADCRRLAVYDQHADPSTHDRSGSG